MPINMRLFRFFIILYRPTLCLALVVAHEQRTKASRNNDALFILPFIFLLTFKTVNAVVMDATRILMALGIFMVSQGQDRATHLGAYHLPKKKNHWIERDLGHLFLPDG